MRNAVLLLTMSLAAGPAAAQYGFNDGAFDGQGATLGGYCYFSLGNCPAGNWTGTHATGLIQSGSPAWGSIPANTPSSYAFVQIAGSLSQTFTATATGSFRFTWYEADRPSLGGQTYIVKMNGLPIGTYSPTLTSFVRQTSSTFSMAAGSTYTVSFEGQSPGVDRSALIDSVRLISVSSQISYVYDALGRITAVTNTGGFADGTATSYSYDSAGNRARVVVSGSH